MTASLRLRAGSVPDLTRYVARQLDLIVPDHGVERDIEQLRPLTELALERMRPILAAVRAFDATFFDHFNSLQYATFLYLLGNEQWRDSPTDAMVDRLFCLNRTLNSIDLFCAVRMPEVFFISHGLGTVLGNAIYGNRCVIFQGVTVGRVADARPTLGSGVVLYPGATVTGNAKIGNNCVIAAGTVVHNVEIPNDTLVSGGNGSLVLKHRSRDYADLYFEPVA